MRDRLISRIMSTVDRVVTCRDMGMALDPGALQAARQLMAWHFERFSGDFVPAGGVDVGVFHTVALLHWMRSKALPPAQAEEDFHAALWLCRVLYDIDPALLAPPMRAFVEEGDANLVALRVRILSDAAFELVHRPDNAGGGVGALDEAASLLQQALLVAASHESEHPALWHQLGIVWRLRFERSGAPDDIGRSQRWHRTAVEAVRDAGEGREERARLLEGLGSALALRFEAYDQIADADEAIALTREAIRVAPVEDECRPMYMGDLANTLLSRFEKTEQRCDLLEAWETIHAALRIAPAGSRHRALVLSNLCRAARLRFDCSDERVFLDEAVDAGREAVALTSPDNVDFPERQNKLSLALQRRFGLLGEPADLHESLRSARSALNAVAPGHPQRPRYLIGLTQTLMLSYEHEGRVADIDEAVDVCRQAVAEQGPEHSHRTPALATLCGALVLRFRESGRFDDVDAAIEAGHQAADAAVPGSGERATALLNLLGALMERYSSTKQGSDLDEAVRVAGQTHDLGELGEVHRREAGINLAYLLTARFAGADGEGDSRDLDQAVDLLRRVLSKTPPGNRLRSWVQSRLAGALLLCAALPGRSQALSEALAICREATTEARDGDPFRAQLLSQFSDTLMTVFNTSRRTCDLNAAIALERQAAESEASPGGRVPHRAGLATKLAIKSRHTGEKADFLEAVQVNRSIAEDERAMPWLRLTCARGWASLAVVHEDFASAVEGYTTAVRLLPLVSWRGIDLKSRERNVSESSGLAADAAACAIAAGDPERAVELLEHGRSVLWAQALHVRDDISKLQAAAPGLAARLLEVRTLLNADEAQQVAAPTGRDFAADPGRRRRARWAREWDELLDRVRRLPGFERFLAPLAFAELAEAAGPAPVVLVNVSQLRCDALIVAKGGVEVVPLPRLTLDTTMQLCNAFLSTTTWGKDAGMAGVLALRSNIASISQWLWSAVAEPVLGFLGHERPPAQGHLWPQVCWSPVGPLSFLPLHAAGDASFGEPGNRTVLDRVISSYTPTLSALARVRRRAATSMSSPGSDGCPPSLLAIGMPETLGSAPLPYVPEELDRLDRRLSPEMTVTPLMGEAADRGTVLRLLDTHSWAHFACHGSQKLEDPGRGGVHLWDGILTVREMAALQLPGAQLAYLSACETAVGGNRLIDEAVHVAAALQLVGYPHVIATLWQAMDHVAPEVADTVYETLVGTEGCPDANRAAAALHRAVRKLRERYPHQPDVWAPYIHIGM